MIVFNLDAKPLNQDLRFCDDYSAKIIKSAISIPLLKYNIIKQKIESSLCNVVKMSSTKLVLKVNEFWFDYGEILTPKHIKNTIKYLLQTSNHARTLLFDVKKIRIKSDTIIFHHKKNIKFVYVLTNIMFSPFNDNGSFCGKYKIKEYEKDYIVVESNKFNSHNYNEIKFNFIKNNLEDVQLFNQKLSNFTNPTTFPVQLLTNNRSNINCYKNYIFFNLSFTNRQFLSPKFKALREIIFAGIPREKIIKKLSPLLNSAYNFLLFKTNKPNIPVLRRYREPIYLTLGYDSFYPNKEICETIKEELEKYNIFLDLQETNYYCRNIKYDLQLNLSFPDYFDDTFYYCSKYFELLTKISDIKKYKKINKLKKLFLGTDNQDVFNELQNIIDMLYIEIPIAIGNAVYLSKNKTFNFVDLNFEDVNIE